MKNQNLITKLKRTLLVVGILTLSLSSIPMMATTAYAAGQSQTVSQQSPNWYESNGAWFIRGADNQAITNSWFQDLDGSWYLLAAGDGHMFAGILKDNATGKSYLLNPNHDGTYGRMISVDGVYNINGKELHLTFNQSHDGTFGAITSGLTSLQNAGIAYEEVSNMPTNNSTTPPQKTQPESIKPSTELDNSVVGEDGLTDAERAAMDMVDKNPSLVGEIGDHMGGEWN